MNLKVAQTDRLSVPENRGRILLIAPQPFFANRGTPLNVRAMVSTLADAGYLVDLLVYPHGEDLDLPGVRVVRSLSIPGIKQVPIGPSWAKIILDFPMFFSALKLVFRNSYAVIHGVEEGGVMAAILARLRKVPYVFDMDSSMTEQLASSGFVKWKWPLRIVAALERWSIRGASSVLTVCQDLSDSVRKIDAHANICQIEDFPVESSNVVDERLIQLLREELSLKEKKTVLYTGNFEKYQGIDLLLRSIPKIMDRFADSVVFVLVGGGENSVTQIESYKRLASELGVGSMVVFAGQRPQEQMGTFMALADVLVSPRTKGGNTPLKLYSYMAAERPIVATRISSHTQVLCERTAYLADADAESFSNALLSALTGELVGTDVPVASAAKELVEERYSRKAFERKLRAVYLSTY